MRWTSRTRALALAPVMLIVAAIALAQAPTPPAPAAPATTPAPASPPAPPSPITGIRNKLSAGDLLSGESILEAHRAQNGADGPWLQGLSWLARGAFLLGDTAKASRYAAEVRAACADSLAHGVALDKSHAVEIALGAAVDVQSRLIEQRRGRPRAVAFLRDELSKITGPVALIARLNQLIDRLTIEGGMAPEIVAEDHLGDAAPPTLASLKGRPVVVFVFAEGCGDCKGQAPTLSKVMARHEGDVQLVALTRYYDDADKRATEKARVDSVWKAVYSGLEKTPVVISTASMERYGGSSTPTFAFVDRAGIVRWYTPTRLTEAELEKAIARISGQPKVAARRP